MSDEVVRTHRAGGVATVTLHRPDRLNAMDAALLDGLLAAVEDAVSDPGVRVVVLTGAGRAFCVGGDLQGFAAGVPDDAPVAARVGQLRRWMRVCELLRACPAVTVAAVNGACAGAGLSLALACDLRLASATAVFRTAFLGAGLSGDFGGTWSLSRLLGGARAAELYLLDEKLPAAEALRLGLVTRVFDPEEFPAAVDAVVTGLAGRAPLALRGVKQNLTDAARLSFAEACDAEAARHVGCSLSADATEAAAAFLERRAPVFTGG